MPKHQLTEPFRRAVGRPKGAIPGTRITITIESGVHAALVRRAEIERRTLSAQVQVSIEDYLTHCLARGREGRDRA